MIAPTRVSRLLGAKAITPERGGRCSMPGIFQDIFDAQGIASYWITLGVSAANAPSFLELWGDEPWALHIERIEQFYRDLGAEGRNEFLTLQQHYIFVATQVIPDKSRRFMLPQEHRQFLGLKNPPAPTPETTTNNHSDAIEIETGTDSSVYLVGYDDHLRIYRFSEYERLRAEAMSRLDLDRVGRNMANMGTQSSLSEAFREINKKARKN